MITQQHRQEWLSRAYVHAVAAKAGCICTAPSLDYGIDITIEDVDEIRPGRLMACSPPLKIQIKSSWNVSYRDNQVIYDLDAKTYNDLVYPKLAIPIILVLYRIPEDEAQWLLIDKEATILKHCAFWISLRGQPPTTNIKTQRIEIPIAQVFNEFSLRGIMDRVKVGGLP